MPFFVQPTYSVKLLSDDDTRELQDAHNVNLCDECDSWLDKEYDVTYTSIVDEDEYFASLGAE